MLMGNIGMPDVKVISIFAIKGSKANRRVANEAQSNISELQPVMV